MAVEMDAIALHAEERCAGPLQAQERRPAISDGHRVVLVTPAGHQPFALEPAQQGPHHLGPLGEVVGRRRQREHAGGQMKARGRAGDALGQTIADPADRLAGDNEAAIVGQAALLAVADAVEQAHGLAFASEGRPLLIRSAARR